MKQIALAPNHSVETTLTVMSGPQKGTVYRVVSGRVTIGRGSDNDIVIDDPKCSRHHAEILLGTHGFEIRDVTDRNVIQVDGQDCKSAMLADRSNFVLGQTQFRFSVKANLPQIQKSDRDLALAPPQDGKNPSADLPRKKKRQKSSPLRFVIAGLILVLLYFGLSPSEKKLKNLTPEQLAEQELKAAQSVKQSAEERYRPKDVSPNDLGYKQAQQTFVEGTRDYRKGQFERALSSFQACLSLFPTHVMCTRYLRLTQRRLDEIIQQYMSSGRAYRDQNQFGACAAAFRNVMVMVRDTTSKRYQEAEANHKACQEHIEERY